MLIACSHCQANLDISSDLYGQVVQCPVCNGKLKIDAPAEDLPTLTGKPVRHGWKESDHANVNALHAFLIGLVSSTIWLACMYIPPIRASFGAIFVDRGWVDFAETWFFFWGMAILYLKYLKIKHQERAILLNLFPSNLGETVNPSNVGAFIDNIYDMPASMRDSIIVNRIRKALELFEARNSKSETEAMLNSSSAVDANRSSGSFSLVKVFIWAIPILGFIGTVQGLAIAVASLNIDASDPAALKAAIGNLTGGLGIAFDTTLLALILSMIMSFPLAVIQKQDEETLTLIDVFCTEKLIPRLHEESSEPNPTSDNLLVQAENLPEMVNSLAKAHSSFLENLNQATIAVRQLLHDNQKATTEIHNTMAQSFNSANAQLLETQKTISRTYTTAADQLTKSATQLISQTEGELNSSLRRIATGIDSFNENMKRAGVPVQGGGGGLFGLFRKN
jgi:biopolymer transport protein ExbB/TolQ